VLHRGPLYALAGLVALAAGFAPPAHAAATKHRHWRIASPDGRLTATVMFLGADAPLQATVRRKGTPVLSTAIGLGTTTRCLPMGFSFLRAGKTTVFQRYRTPAGKRREHRHLARRLVLEFKQGDSAMTVELQLSDDGLAYRMALRGRARSRLKAECSSFTAPPGTSAWLQRYSVSYEGPYDPTPLAGAAPGPVGFPALLETGGAWALLSESSTDRGQPASHLDVLPGGVLGLARPRQGPGLAEVRTSWRVAVIGSLATIVESDLVDDLAEPARSEKWSWVQPGRAAWSWWSDSSSPASLERQKQYVDFAARAGWEYVLVDAGWDPAWIPALTAYARKRRVRVLLWSRWDALTPKAQRDALLSQWRTWGVAGVKLDFMLSDSNERMRWYRAVARAAAERRLLVNFHGSTVPRGMSRTWPNVLTSEGVLGSETYKGEAPVTPVHNATLPFTRNAIGSMDYTPVTFSAPRRQTSAAHELALSVVFESGLQHFADSPEGYAAMPAARRWLRRVPVAWDDTRLLGGYPGGSATIARRAGRRWYVGAIEAGAGGTAVLPLDFLYPGRRYVARIVEDASGGRLRTSRRRVNAKRVLRLRVGRAGGFAVRFTPVRKRR
jgi:alpha-glucosidase